MSLHIIVCIKSVVTHAKGGRFRRSLDSCELNLFDRPVLETALRLKQEQGGSVTAISMGPESATSALLESMAMGVDRGILLSDPGLADSDTLATSRALVAAIEKVGPFDLLFFGTRTSDSDTGQVGPETAVMLNLPLVTSVHSIEFSGKGLTVERRADELLEKFELSLPAALTIHPVAVTPRDIGLRGIELALEKEALEKWDLAKIGLAPHLVGQQGSGTRLLSMTRVVKKRKCELISGATEEQADELTKRLVDAGLVG